MGTSYDIHYPQVLGVLTKALGQATAYDADQKALEDALAQADAALTHSGPVSGRLAGYVEAEAGPQLRGIFGHTNSALTGTSTAANAYRLGDVQMAQTAQRNATTAEYPDDLPGRPGHGHPTK